MKKTVLITGATSGIGLALAHLFAKAGEALVLVARYEETLKPVSYTHLTLPTIYSV